MRIGTERIWVNYYVVLLPEIVYINLSIDQF
jgi:hypothetical protein